MFPLSQELLCRMVFMHVNKRDSLKQINTALHVLFNFIIFCQKRGRCKGTIPLSSVKAVEFVDDTTFDNNKYCNCFQVGTSEKFVSI